MHKQQQQQKLLNVKQMGFILKHRKFKFEFSEIKHIGLNLEKYIQFFYGTRNYEKMEKPYIHASKLKRPNQHVEDKNINTKCLLTLAI